MYKLKIEKKIIFGPINSYYSNANVALWRDCSRGEEKAACNRVPLPPPPPH